MAKIIKAEPGNAPRLDGTPGEYEWTEAGETVDVDDVTANYLLRIPGFTEAAPDAKTLRQAQKVTAEPVPVEEPKFAGPEQAVTEPAPAAAAPVAEAEPVAEPVPGSEVSAE